MKSLSVLLYKVWSYLSGEQEAAATRASRAMVLGIMVTGVSCNNTEVYLCLMYQWIVTNGLL